MRGGEVSLSGYFEGRYTEFRPVQTRRGLGQSLPVLELESSGHKAPESEGSSDSTWKPKRASSTIEDWFEKDSSKLREELQERGIEMARWIEDPGAANCPTTQCNMSRQDLIQATGGVVYESPVYRPFGQIEYSLYLPPVEVLPRQDGDYKTLNAEGRNIKCNTVMSKYIIIIENVFRDPPEDEPNYPHISESVVTMFNTTFETTEMLRYIFVSTVVNLQTRDYIDNVLYPDGYESIPEYQQGAPDREADYPKPDYFARGTPAYQEILGTRIGRMVGSIVLAAFPRGTRRITGIHIWTCTGGMQFRFDLRSN
ncbi:hypothetical protein N7507_001708 [Penicillium longicatenatum]|nr:hypothetical protein N7507_001708 [Penicillium longicatenatum]